MTPKDQTEQKTASRAWVWAGWLCALAVVCGGVGLWLQYQQTVSAPRARAPMAVRVAPIRTADVTLTESFSGELFARAAELSAESSGRLLSVKKDLGDPFTKGELLAEVDSTEMRRVLAESLAQVRVETAESQRSLAELDKAKRQMERGRQLFEAGLLSVDELQTLEAQARVWSAQFDASEASLKAARARVSLYREQLNKTELRAPFDGQVAQRFLEPGAMLQPGTRVLRLLEAGPLKVRFRVGEQQVSRLDVGARLSVQTSGLTSPASGSVERLSAEVSSTDRSVLVQGILVREEPALRSGMYATVSVELGALPGATLVPAAALTERMAAKSGSLEPGVLTVVGERAEYHPVQILGRFGQEVAVAGEQLSGQVITFGQQSVGDGDPVRTVSGAAE